MAAGKALGLDACGRTLSLSGDAVQLAGLRRPHPCPLGGDYGQIVTRRIEEDVSPDIFQINGMQYMRTSVAGGIVAPLSDLFKDDDFLVDAKRVGVDGVPYGVPMNAIRDNVIFVNLKVFRDAGVTEAELAALKGDSATFQDLFAVADKIAAYYEAEGIAGTPFGVFKSAGDVKSDNPNIKYPWAYKDVFLDCLLPGTLGLTEWQSLMDSPSPAKWQKPAVAEALTNLKHYVDRSNQDLLMDCEECAPWDTIVEGKSAMTVLGDWYVSTFRKQGLVYGKDWDSFACPGTAGAFLGHTDMWVMPPSAPHPENAKRFLEIAAMPEIQLAFNAQFGALPATKVDISQLSDKNGFDGYSRANYKDMQSYGFRWRTEAQTITEFTYLAVLGPFAENVLGIDMTSDSAAVDIAVEKAVQGFAALCMDTGSCK